MVRSFERVMSWRLQIWAGEREGSRRSWRRRGAGGEFDGGTGVWPVHFGHCTGETPVPPGAWLLGMVGDMTPSAGFVGTSPVPPLADLRQTGKEKEPPPSATRTPPPRGGEGTRWGPPPSAGADTSPASAGEASVFALWLKVGWGSRVGLVMVDMARPFLGGGWWGGGAGLSWG